MFGRARNIFPHSPSSIWSGYDCHSPVRSFAHSELTQHLFSCLFNPIYASAWLRWKGGKWWKLSCLFTWNSFHSSAKRVQAPNDTNSEMKAANLTVRHWIVVSGCSLPTGVSQLEEPMCEKLLGFLSRWGWGEKKHLIYELLLPLWIIKGHFVNSVDVSLLIWCSFSMICAQTNSILHLSPILGDNSCLW